MNKLPIPNTLKFEYYERKLRKANFDRIDFALDFKAGRDGVGCVAHKWVDGVINHDAIVKKIEEQMDLIDQLRKIYNSDNRTFQNWDAAFNEINLSPVEYAEYCELRPGGLTFIERAPLIEDETARSKAEAEFLRFKALEPTCYKVYDAEQTLKKARDTRDEGRKRLVAAETALASLRVEEVELSRRISDDHVVADSRGMHVSEVFPNVHLGNILVVINETPVEGLPFEDVLKVIDKFRSPHRVAFKRYDYRMDPITDKWLSLEELREMKVFVEDARSQRYEFIKQCSQGLYDKVKLSLMSGEDCNAYDDSGCSALHAAIVESHFDVVDLLILNGSNVDSRDKNMMTPMLSCVGRGLLDGVRHLINHGADKTVSDRIHRNALYFAVKSGSLGMIRQFINPESCNQHDSLWGWTPLHCAANKGDMKVVKLLLDFGASIFMFSKKGKTPEDVAKDAGHEEVRQYLEHLRLTAPAQLVYTIESTNTSLWIGDKDALVPKFIHETDLKSVLYITEPDEPLPRSSTWLKGDEIINHEFLKSEVLDDDDETDTSWKSFSSKLNDVINFVTISQKGIPENTRNNILICDPSGQSTSPAALTSFLLLKYQVKVAKGVEMCATARPIIDMSMSMRRGLELLQRGLEERKMKRLNDRVRNSTSMSVAF